METLNTPLNRINSPYRVGSWCGKGGTTKPKMYSNTPYVL